MNILDTYHSALLAQAAYGDGLNNAKNDTTYTVVDTPAAARVKVLLAA